jgi:hypothetical protein
MSDPLNPGEADPGPTSDAPPPPAPPGPKALPEPPEAPPPLPPGPGAVLLALAKYGQSAPGAPTPTSSCSPEVTGTVAVTEAPSPPLAGVVLGAPQRPPAAPIAVTEMLVTPTGTVNVLTPAVEYTAEAVVAALALLAASHPKAADTAIRASGHRPPDRAHTRMQNHLLE